jgi:hypothetical protein
MKSAACQEFELIEHIKYIIVNILRYTIFISYNVENNILLTELN